MFDKPINIFILSTIYLNISFLSYFYSDEFYNTISYELLFIYIFFIFVLTTFISLKLAKMDKENKLYYKNYIISIIADVFYILFLIKISSYMFI